MTNMTATPPRLAQVVARAFLRDREVDSITGDLLEEYREMQGDTLGKRRAYLWYIAQVLSIAGRVVWPPIAAVIALRLISFPLPPGWNPSVVPAPGTSMLDALIFVWAAYHGVKRTGRVVTGIVSVVAVGLVGFVSFFVYALATEPSLIRAPFTTPFVIVIFCVLLTIAMTFAVVAGMLGAALARWRNVPPQPAA